MCQVHAQGIDPSQARATIGAPLDLQLFVRPAPELGATRFDRRCVYAEAQIGERLVDNQALRIEIGQAGDDGLNPIRLHHPVIVDEPVVQLRISLLCGASYSREFNVLAFEPPALTPKSGADARKTTQRGTTRVAAPRTDIPAHQPRQRTARTPDPAASQRPQAEGEPPADAAMAAAPSSASELQALARSVMKLLQAAGLGRPAGSLPAPADNLPPEVIAQNSYLLQELQRLRGEQQQASTAIASLHARLARTEDDRWMQAGWMAFATLGGLILFGVLVRLGDGLIPLIARRWRLARDEPTLQTGRRSPRPPPATATQTWQDDPPQSRPVHPPSIGRPEGAPAAPADAPVTSPTIDFDAEPAGLPLHAVTPSTSTQAGHGNAHDLSAEQQSRAQRWSKASFGPASLDHDIVRPLRDDIDSAIDRGYLGFAATMLEQTLYSGAGKHPWALMRLLEVYDALGQPDNHDRVCAEIEALYSVRPPSYGSRDRDDRDASGSQHAAPSLLETLADWPALCAAWAEADAPALIETCLLRGRNRFDLDLPTFADLLFLHELAQTRNTLPVVMPPQSPPEPSTTQVTGTPASADRPVPSHILVDLDR